jgi:hypothetical protein
VSIEQHSRTTHYTNEIETEIDTDRKRGREREMAMERGLW